MKSRQVKGRAAAGVGGAVAGTLALEAVDKWLLVRWNVPLGWTSAFATWGTGVGTMLLGSLTDTAGTEVGKRASRGGARKSDHVQCELRKWL